MNETMNMIENRTSIRKFNGQPIAEEHMSAIIKAAMRAPTAGNMMMYSIIRIKNRDTLKALSESCDHQSFIANADTVLIFVADMNKWHRYFVAKDVPQFAEKTGRTYEGPELADFMLAVNDALIAAQNAVVAAESFGIGSCYIGDIMENIEYHRELLGLPAYVFPATMLVFGHYDSAPKPRERFDEKFVVFEEKYSDLSDEAIEAMFEKKEEKFTGGTESAFENFAQQFYNRKIGAAFFEEMNRSIEQAIKDWTRKG